MGGNHDNFSIWGLGLAWGSNIRVQSTATLMSFAEQLIYFSRSVFVGGRESNCRAQEWDGTSSHDVVLGAEVP